MSTATIQTEKGTATVVLDEEFRFESRRISGFLGVSLEVHHVFAEKGSKIPTQEVVYSRHYYKDEKDLTPKMIEVFKKEAKKAILKKKKEYLEKV